MEGRIECVECICASTCHPKPPCTGTQSNKPSGDGEVATVAGDGCRWKLLVTTLHAGGPGVTVAWSSTVESRCHSYPARASEQPCLGVALLSLNGEGNKKRFLKKLTQTRLARKPRRAGHPTLRSKRYIEYMHMECENVTR